MWDCLCLLTDKNRPSCTQDGLFDVSIGAGFAKGAWQFRTCIHNRGMPDGRGFFLSDKEIFHSHTDVWQGKATQYGDRGPRENGVFVGRGGRNGAGVGPA